MKHLLTGVAMAAALAIAAPVWAQNAPMTPSAPPSGASTAMPTAPSSSTPMASKPMAKKPMHHRMASHRRMMGQGQGGDQMTNQLNQQELQRIQGGNMSPPGGGMAPPGGGMAPNGGMNSGGMNSRGMAPNGGMNQGGMAPNGGMNSGGMAPSGGMGAPPPAR